ncbi:MAG TPA: hypothetical protein VEF07_02100, partial [Candidatus Binataceae bacterium]|nr:hypothetical protein [Candidatus Binataceae bacterium]
MKRRTLFLFLFLAMSSACANLSAVRDFAKTSSSITANEPVISGWPSTYDTAKLLAASPQMKSRAPDFQPTLEQEAKKVKPDV